MTGKPVDLSRSEEKTFGKLVRADLVPRNQGTRAAQKDILLGSASKKT